MDLGFAHLSVDLRASVSAQFARLARRWVAVFCDVEGRQAWHDDLEDSGLEYIRTAYWHRTRGAPQFTGDRPASSCECIVLAHPEGRKAWNGGGKAGFYEYPVVANCAGHRADRIHTTQKPTELMCEIVEDFTDPDELILDPFAGSGTTGLAAHRLGRRVILIEKDPAHAQTCIDSMRAADAGSSVQAMRMGQTPLFGS